VILRYKVSRQHLNGLALEPNSINYEVVRGYPISEKLMMRSSLQSLYYVEYQPARDGTNLTEVTLVDEGECLPRERNRLMS